MSLVPLFFPRARIHFRIVHLLSSSFETVSQMFTFAFLFLADFTDLSDIYIYIYESMLLLVYYVVHYWTEDCLKIVY